VADIYVLAPYSVHAELAVREEKAFGRWQDKEFLALPFRDIKRISFKEGDIAMVRGLRSVQSVKRMKAFTADLITQGLYADLIPVLIGLDNYQMRKQKVVFHIQENLVGNLYPKATQ